MSRTVCVTQPLLDEFPLDTEQPVKIAWLEANMPDEVIRFTFTYKPDPQVNSIHPDVTILRYNYLILYMLDFQEDNNRSRKMLKLCKGK